MLEQKQKISQQKGLIISFLELESFRACEQKKKKDTEKQSIGNFSAKIVLDKSQKIPKCSAGTELLHKPLRPGHDPVKRRMIKEFAVKEIEYVTAHVLSSQ